MCVYACDCVYVCGHFCVLEFDRDNEKKKKKKKRKDVMVKDISGCRVHILTHRQAERSSFHCKCG